MSIVPYFDWFADAPRGWYRSSAFSRDPLMKQWSGHPFARELIYPMEQWLQPWESALRSMRSWEQAFEPLERQLSTTMDQLCLQDPNSSVVSNDDKFQVRVDVQHFAPEEIKVNVKNGFVEVEGKHEEQRDEHGYVSRQFVRRYRLPTGCLPDAVSSSLSSDGVLTVTAPAVLALPSAGEKIVPIQHTGPVKQKPAIEQLK